MSETVALDAIAGVAPASVVRPASLGELQEVVRDFSGGTLVPLGGATRAALGRPPAGTFSILELGGALSGEVEHNASDMTAVVPAGLSIEAVNAVLARHGQRLPWDPAHPDRATIGGTLATGTNGPLASRYGQPRDQLLGATVLRADGEFVRAGGRVVKNVTGYDLLRLWCGSLGTLGIFTSVALRVYPDVPAATLRFLRPTAERAAELAERFYRADLRAELLDITGNTHGWGVVGRFPVTSVARARSLGGWADEAADVDYVHCRDLGWRDGDGITFYVRCLPSSVAGVASLLVDEGASVVARVISGTVVATWPDVEESRGLAIEVADRLRDGVLAASGSLVVERMPPRLRGQLDTWGPAPGTFAIMKRLKLAYDAGGKLNAGRFIGGL